MTPPILAFAQNCWAAIARVAASAVRAFKADVAREFRKAWTDRNAEIFRQRSLDLLDFADRRLDVGPNGAAWMTPDELAFFRQFNAFYWRVISKAEDTTSAEERNNALRTSQAAATRAATGEAARRRRNPPPASRRTKTNKS